MWGSKALCCDMMTVFSDSNSGGKLILLEESLSVCTVVGKLLNPEIMVVDLLFVGRFIFLTVVSGVILLNMVEESS